ncbi:hypothetical protein CEW89_11380 [Celeribacter ethanolicus]|uniref:DUF2946 domain-containing protein n=1 Tax=Celeribacter ethanolicus TaxID=1758178 RepID=A0A291GCJ7_9RHOB|nr:hypothetical protein CEW89_11380 [Celeribacter ethanolicus]
MRRQARKLRNKFTVANVQTSEHTNVMGDGFLNMRVLRGFWAMCLAALLAVQVSIAFGPDARSDVTLSETEVLLQLCGTPGDNTTLVFDTATGTVREVPSGDGSQGADCPYCVVGAAFLVAEILLPEAAGRLHKAEIAPTDTHQIYIAQRDFSRSTRAPPRIV